MKIYISGAITGTDDYFERFMAAQNELKELLPNAEIVNPVLECAKAGMTEDTHTWGQFMDFCLNLMKDCTHQRMLPGWSDSRGACVEFYMGKAMDLVAI